MTVFSRAQGCLWGQITGDALGNQVEFQSPEEIHRVYPNGVRELVDGGTWLKTPISSEGETIDDQ